MYDDMSIILELAGLQIAEPFQVDSTGLTGKSGTYVKAVPSPATTPAILEKIAEAGLSPLQKFTKELHVTLMYSKTEALDNDAGTILKNMPEVQNLRATVKNAFFITGHKNQGVIALGLESPALDRIYIFLSQRGVTHSYPKLLLHMTIGNNVQPSDFNAAKKWAMVLSTMVRGLVITFDKIVIEDIS